MTITIRIPHALIKYLLTAGLSLAALLTLTGAGCVACIPEVPRWGVLIYGVSVPLSLWMIGDVLYDLWNSPPKV